MASYGALYHGPLGHVFYGNLNKAIPTSSRVDILKKVRIFSLSMLYNVSFACIT